MTKYLVLFLISCLASLALTPLVRALALRLGAVDRPGERKIHTKPVPRLGGISLVVSVALTILLGLAFEDFDDFFIPIDLVEWTPVLLGGSIVFLTGAWDDIRPLPAGTKFLFQAAAAGLAIWMGVMIDEVSFFDTGSLGLGALAIPLTFLWIVGITNAFNLIDGLDGLAAGLASIAAGTCAAIFLLRGNAQDAMLLVILLGALVGFLWYNFNPARIFLGDSGSLLVGYVLAVTAIAGSQKGATAMAVVVPLLVFGLPILDTLLSMARRFVGGLKILGPYKASLKQRILASKRMFEADQGHIHHRLIAMGFSQRNAVLVMYTIALGLSSMALVSVFAQFRNAGIILIAVGLATYIGVRKLGYEEVTFLKSGTLLRWSEQVTFNRPFFLGFVDMVLITAAYWLSFVLKYEFDWTAELKNWYLSVFSLVLVIQLGTFALFGLYRGVWRATGVGDLIRIAFAVFASVSLSYILVQISVSPNGTLAFFVIDLLVLGAMVGGSRSLYRIVDYSSQQENGAGGDTLIYGAGKGGQLALRELLQNSELGLRPVGFLDDDPRLRERTINRMPVLGSSEDLATILESRPVASVVIASDKITSGRLERVLALCEDRNVPVLHAQMALHRISDHGTRSPIESDGNGDRDEQYVRRDEL